MSVSLIISLVVRPTAIGLPDGLGFPFECSVQADAQLGNPTIVAAKRFSKLTRMTRHRNGRPSEEKTTYSAWTASEEALARLQELVIEGEWVSRIGYTLIGGRTRTERYSVRQEWIDCEMSDGSLIRLAIWRSGREIHDSTNSFKLDASQESCRNATDITLWNEIVYPGGVSIPIFIARDGLRNRLSHGSIKLKSSLSYERGIQPPTILCAERIIPKKEFITADGELRLQEKKSLGWAFPRTIKELESVIFGVRNSSLLYKINGEVRSMRRDEKPQEQIICRMSDGKDVIVNVFSTGQAWQIAGEDSFVLNDPRGRNSSILSKSKWSKSVQVIPIHSWPYRCSVHNLEMGALKIPANSKLEWEVALPSNPHSIFYGDTTSFSTTIDAFPGVLTLLSCPACERYRWDPNSSTRIAITTSRRLVAPNGSAGKCKVHSTGMVWVYNPSWFARGKQSAPAAKWAPNDPLAESFEYSKSAHFGAWRSACADCIGRFDRPEPNGKPEPPQED